jgi:hypothetical protein
VMSNRVDEHHEYVLPQVRMLYWIEEDENRRSGTVDLELLLTEVFS